MQRINSDSNNMARPEARIMMFGVAVVILAIAHGAAVEKKGQVCGRPADIALVLDSSNSIGHDFDNYLTPFVKQLVTRFQIAPDKVRFSLVTFGHEVNTQHVFNFDEYTDKQSLLDRLDTVTYIPGEFTRTDLGVHHARKYFFPTARPEAKKIEVIITDGNPRGPDYDDTVPEDLAEEIKKTSRGDVTIFAIGVGPKINDENLEAMATSPDYTYRVGDYAALTRIEAFLAAELCDQSEELRLDCPPADIALVLDSSNSIGHAFNEDLMPFVKTLVKHFLVSPLEMRFSLLTFGHEVNQQHVFNFNEYPDEESLLNQLDTVEKVPGQFTRTDLAVKYARKKFFPTARPEARKIEVIITDGNPRGPKYKDTVPADLATEIEETLRGDVTIFAIGVGYNISYENLKAMATSPVYTYRVDNYDALTGILAFLAEDLCLPKIQPPPDCPKAADIALVLDNSNSVGHKFNDELMPFVINLVKHFPISEEEYRFSLLTFGHEVNQQHEFAFDKYTDAESLLKRLDTVKSLNGTYTRTDLAVQEAREKFFSDRRPNVPRIEIIITDGNARGPDGNVLEILAEEIKLTKAMEVTIFAIGVGYNITEENLQAMATSEEYATSAPSYEALKKIEHIVLEKTCDAAGDVTD